MNKEKMKLYGFMIVTTLVVATLILFIVNGIEENGRKKREEEAQVMDKIEKSYDNFVVTLEEFATEHDDYITELTEKTSINTAISSNYKDLKATVENYEKRLSEIEGDSKFLYDSCYKKYTNYNRKSTNTDCLKYIRNMEQIINSFLEDVKYVNTRIEEYNKWTETYNDSSLSLTTYKKVDKIKATKYTDYVDLDEDGIYLGRLED